MHRSTRSACALLLLLTMAGPVAAQSEPPAGVRATGMGGAFVAVADDASAVFWNPAGLASGSYFSLALDTNRLQTADDSSFPHSRSAFMLALGTPALGLSYVRTNVTRATQLVSVIPADVAAEFEALGLAVPDGPGFLVERLAVRSVGATVVQSLTDSLAVGTTLKLVRGTASNPFLLAGDPSSFDRADDSLPKKGTTKFDADVGVMLSGAFAKVGLAVRNALEPEFSTPAGASIPLERRVRGGLSLQLLQAITVAADVDFTRTSTTRGRWRDAAIGAEARPLRKGFVRGGLHWNTAGGDGGPGAAPVFSVGGSYGVYGSVLADGQVSFGSANGDTGWGVGVRFVF